MCRLNFGIQRKIFRWRISAKHYGFKVFWKGDHNLTFWPNQTVDPVYGAFLQIQMKPQSPFLFRNHSITTHHISRFWLRHFFEYFILSASIPLKWKYIRRFLLFKVNWSQALSRCDRGIFVMFVISRVDGSRTNLSLSLFLSHSDLFIN